MDSARKRAVEVLETPEGHWVGDGFPVKTLFSYDALGAELSPFLLLDYAGPAEFPPTEERRGVGEHPHRGFETVTVVYQGEVEHADSRGNRGSVGPGDVQWMSAASGVVHEEMHGRAFARKGGTLEMVQLWVNLPAHAKMSEPRYQDLRAADIPEAALPQGAGTARVIAGELSGARGPARTATPVTLLDLRLKAGKKAVLGLAEGHSAAVLALRGRVRAGGSRWAGPAELVVLGQKGAGLELEAAEDASALLLGGEPIREPIAGYGPFVMNSEAELRRAFEDYRGGKMGRLPDKGG